MQLLNFLTCPILAVALKAFVHWPALPYHCVKAILKHGNAEGARTMVVALLDDLVDRTDTEGKIRSIYLRDPEPTLVEVAAHFE